MAYEGDGAIARSIAVAAAREDPSLPEAAGEALALVCLREVRQTPDATPASLARKILSLHPETDTSWANQVARLTLVLVNRH